jgi:hypothetical protein
MKFEKIYNTGQAGLFRNKYLEYFTKSHPLVIWSICFPLIIFMFYYSLEVIKPGKVTTILVFAGGLLFWTFFEYIILSFALSL